MQNFEATKSNPSQTAMATCKNLTPSQQPDRTRVSLVPLCRLMLQCQEPALNHLTETTRFNGGFLVHGEETVLQVLQQEWERIQTQTS